jgi:hypothetical protein
MDATVLREIETRRRDSIAELRGKYRAQFGEEPRTRNRRSLIRRLAWRMQALAEGGLSDRARQRALEIANDADVRVLAPRDVLEVGSGRFDRRIPPPGTVLSREYRGQTISVKVLAHGFEYEGRHYRSLSAIAMEVTGTRWNGLAFFGLTRKEGTPRAAAHQ